MTEGSLIKVICSLIGAARGQEPVKISPFMENQDRVSIECLLAHASCGGSNCSRAVVVESWTLQRKRRSQEEGLASLFLLNAIRSHLHFSQLNAFLSQHQLPPSVVCTYRISTGSNQHWPSNMSVHNFPVCKLDRDHVLAVSLEYLKKEAITIPLGFCLSLENVTNDLWLLPSPTETTPENSVHPQDFAEEINRLKHKLPPCSPTGEPKSKVAHNLSSKLQPKPEQQTIEKLTSSLNSLAARSRQRTKSGSQLFNKVTGLPSHSSPAPLSRQRNFSASDVNDLKRSTALLGSFEESALKDRLEPVKKLDGYKIQITASGSFSPPHTTLGMKVNIFDENEADPLPSLGTCNLSSCGRKGYRIPRQGMLQATVFNPQGTIVKVFLVPYDVSDMPSSSQTFIRQRTFLDSGSDKHLQYLIHFRLASDRSNRVYLHTDIRVLFSQNSSLSGLNIQVKDNVGMESEKYHVTSELQTPVCPKYSPKK